MCPRMDILYLMAGCTSCLRAEGVIGFQVVEVIRRSTAGRMIMTLDFIFLLFRVRINFRMLLSRLLYCIFVFLVGISTDPETLLTSHVSAICFYLLFFAYFQRQHLNLFFSSCSNQYCRVLDGTGSV